MGAKTAAVRVGQELGSALENDNVFECVNCRQGGLDRDSDCLRCRACGQRFAILFDVPIVLKKVAWSSGGSLLSDSLAAQACERVYITPSVENIKCLQEILAYRYELPDLGLTAENNHFLMRIDLAKPPAGPWEKEGVSVNQDIRVCFEDHYIPRRLPPGKLLSKNVSLRNIGTSLLSSRTQAPVHIACRWRDAAGCLLPLECPRTQLPVDLSPGRIMTVPVRVDTPAREGIFALELTLVQEAVRWLDDSSRFVEIEITSMAEDGPGVNWIETGHTYESYDVDHRAGRDFLLAEINRRQRSHLKILELGGCCNPQVEALGIPCDLFNVDIDIQTLQVGQLRFGAGPRRIAFVAADANDLPFRAEAFDAIVMFSTLHHFANPIEMLRRLRRCLKKDGFLAVLCEPVGHYHNGVGTYDRLLQEMTEGINEQTFSLAEYRYIFDQAGWETLRVQADVGSLKAILKIATKPSTIPVTQQARPNLLPKWARRLTFGLLATSNQHGR
jgi:ubiquinone/menaquinone biosynthesis C-methylase UbiE